MADTNTPIGLEGNQDDLLLDQLDKIAMSPNAIRGIFLMLTRIHWSDAEHYGSMRSKIGKFIWSRDDRLRTLFIDFDYNYDPSNLDKRPAIFVGTSDLSYRKVAIDHLRTRSEDRATDDYVMVASTNIIIRHIGKTPDESWAMGDLTGQFFLGMRKMLQERLKVHAFDIAQLMASKPFEAPSQKADQQFIVDLIMNLQFNAVWLSTREGHRLKTVRMRQTADFTMPAKEDVRIPL